MHVVGTAGHVDHGKSALVQALTGIDPDRFAEEKRRGLTIDLGFAWCTLPSGREIGIVDVPGHERFIRNMLAGAGAIDVVVLVVAVDEGWMPQSAEHLQILDLLATRGGVVALTKSDLAEADALDLAAEDVSQRLRGTCLRDAPIVRVSAKTGAGLDDLRRELDSLLARTPQGHSDGPPRMFIDRSFTIAGAGTVVTGTLTNGRLRVGDDVEIAPDSRRARIRSLQTHKRHVDEAIPTSRVAINLVGLDRTDIARGDAVVLPGQRRSTTTFAARLDAVAGIAHPVTARGAYELYLGTADPRCRIKLIGEVSDSDAIVAVSTPSGPAPALKPGGSAFVQLFSARALPVDVGDRFVLRDVGRREVVAGGVVVDQHPGTIRRGDPAEIARLRAREGLVGAELAERIVAERKVIASAELRVLSGTVLSGAAFEVDAGYAGHVAERARSLVERYHDEHPLEIGMPRDELRVALQLQPDAFAYLLPTFRGLAVDGNHVRSAERRSHLDAGQRAAADGALGALRAAGATPPTVTAAGLPIQLAKTLEREGELVFISRDIAYPSDVWQDIERRVAQQIDAAGPVTVAQVRDLLGASRKYAVPLLEKLDATGVTRRKGDVRELGPRGRELVAS